MVYQGVSQNGRWNVYADPRRPGAYMTITNIEETRGDREARLATEAFFAARERTQEPQWKPMPTYSSFDGGYV
jgi:hypothetical protein